MTLKVLDNLNNSLRGHGGVGLGIGLGDLGGLGQP